MINSNATIYLGPVWGQSDIISSSKTISSANSLVFYGGYLFFNNNSNEEIQKLLSLQIKMKNVQFNLSRFEDYFLTIAGLCEEKNYQFKRWINPLSGILSATEYYGIAADELFEAPENISTRLQTTIKFKNDLTFYQRLQRNLLPVAVITQIEKSIEDKEAFTKLSLYDSSGTCIEKIAFPENVTDKYVTRCHELISSFENRGLKL